MGIMKIQHQPINKPQNHETPHKYFNIISIFNVCQGEVFLCPLALLSNSAVRAMRNQTPRGLRQGRRGHILNVPFGRGPPVHCLALCSFLSSQGCTNNLSEDYNFSCLWPLLKRRTWGKITGQHPSEQLSHESCAFSSFDTQSWMGCMCF